ncbi:hypothetical protein CGRA01v4_08714 [Colletotrichum graminicola]|nr:hypothetical protein CGRA01v4_08714 [Colletotrichum graminicola]
MHVTEGDSQYLGLSHLNNTDRPTLTDRSTISPTNTWHCRRLGSPPLNLAQSALVTIQGM